VHFQRHKSLHQLSILLMEIVHGPTGALCACRFHVRTVLKMDRAEQN
jgi:hypothetical protein